MQYGGFYGPVTTSYILSQNELITEGRPTIANATVLPLRTLGILNGCIDSRAMTLGIPEFAYNNTYGIQAYSREVYEEAIANITRPETGCHALIDTCRSLAAEGDPEYFGTNETVNAACFSATYYCYMVIENSFARLSNVRASSTLSNIPHG